MSSKIEQIKEKYAVDADAMASKSRFGYFSMLPSHTAAHTDFAQLVRTSSLTQPRKMRTDASKRSRGTSTVATPPLLPSRRTTSPTHPLPSTALPTRIQARTNADNRWNKIKSKKAKTASDPLNSISHCKSIDTKNV